MNSQMSGININIGIKLEKGGNDIDDRKNPKEKIVFKNFSLLKK